MKRILPGILALSAVTLVACDERPAPAPPPPPAAAAPAEQGIPIRVRVIRGSRKGAAHVDPKLADLKKQLSKLSYVKWEQVKEQDLRMVDKHTQFVDLPDGEHVALTLQDVRGSTVTFEVAMAQRNTQSRLTIEKEKRLVHQVTREKDGVAYFVTMHAWP